MTTLTDAQIAEIASDARDDLVAANGYEPWDQDARLGEPPWRGKKVDDWMAAHGHDPRLKCYPEFGCQVLDVPYARAIIVLVERLAATGL